MKRIIIVLMAAALSLPSSLQAKIPPYVAGSLLNVFAPSGMKLRAFPNQAAHVLDIVEFGDQVKVLNTFDFAEEKAARIDWIDGHWIFVEFGGVAGYLFDGYLSDMPFPGSRDELLADGYSFAYSLGQYMEQHFVIEHLLDSLETSLQYQLEDGTIVKRQIDEDYWIVEIETPSFEAHEVLNLMRSMIPDRKTRSLFEKSLLFIEDERGKISEIKVRLGDEALIRKQKNGKVLVRAMGHSGC